MPGIRRKHVPLRTCIACHQQRAKRELIRVVRTPEGTLEIDPRGKRAGRGAYLCTDGACWETAQGKLGHALRVPIDAEQMAALRAEAALVSAQKAPEAVAGSQDNDGAGSTELGARVIE